MKLYFNQANTVEGSDAFQSLPDDPLYNIFAAIFLDLVSDFQKKKKKPLGFLFLNK